MRSIASGLAAATLAALLFVPQAFAQEPPKPRPRAEHDCAKAPDPARCEARRAERRAARDACRAKPEGERHGCMAEALCAKSEDPGRCKARAAERAEKHKARHAERERMREACKGREGEARHECMREQRGHRPPARS